MEISDRVRITDLYSRIRQPDVPANVQALLLEVLNRVNMIQQDLLYQLKNQPTIYTVNPDIEPDKVSGAKTGDIAVFKNAYGDVEIVRFD
jgi:hypothetical protein